MNSQTLLASLANLDTAYKKFFQKKAKFPKFKKEYSGYQSYQCPQHVKVHFSSNTIDLPKIKGVKAELHRKFDGKIKTCTIKKTPTNKYFISVLVESKEIEPIATTITTEQTIGIDLGIKSLLITSDNHCQQNNKYLDRNQSKLKKLQRRLAKKVEKSSNRAKARQRLACLHEKIANQRLDSIHKASANLVYKTHATSFAVEDLNVKGMMKNHKLARAISDCSWSKFLDLLEYKSKWSGKNVITINRWAASSKTCSRCKHKKEDLKLSDRIYVCNSCNLEIDRDLNAAINIKRFALE